MPRSGSYDKTVRVWDGERKLCVRVMEGSKHRVLAVACEHESGVFASGDAGGCIRVCGEWNSTSSA